jgi:hypothetical protein
MTQVRERDPRLVTVHHLTMQNTPGALHDPHGQALRRLGLTTQAHRAVPGTPRRPRRLPRRRYRRHAAGTLPPQMATWLTNQHQPVRVIRSAGSTYTDRPAQPWLTGRQPRPARRPTNSPPQHPAIGIPMRAAQPPATGRRAERPGPGPRPPPRPRGRPMVSGRVINRMAHRIRSAQPQYPGIRTGSSARDRSNRSGCSRCPAARSSLGCRAAALRACCHP